MTFCSGQTPTILGQLCIALWDTQSQPDVIQPGFEPGTIASCTETQCLRLLRHSRNPSEEFITTFKTLEITIPKTELKIRLIFIGAFCKPKVGYIDLISDVTT